MTKPIRNNIAIILSHPQMGENIGATARAMKNFGISDLRIVSPRDGWPNEKAISMSVGAGNIIKNAKIHNSLESAISDIEYLYAATAVPRDMNKDYVLSRNIASDIPSNSSIGIMFGRESSGLTNTEIAYANKILTIDTDVNFSSLNIAHAVSVICYEIFQTNNQTRSDLKNTQKLAKKDQIEYFYKSLFSILDNKDFFRVQEKKDNMALKIRNLFDRIDNLSESELQILHGIINSISRNTENK